MTEYFEVGIEDCTENRVKILKEPIGIIQSDSGLDCQVTRSGLVYYVRYKDVRYSISLASVLTYMAELCALRIAEEEQHKRDVLTRGVDETDPSIKATLDYVGTVIKNLEGEE